MVVQLRGPKSLLDDWASPDSVDAVFRATVQGAESVAFIKCYEESGPRRLERATLENLGNKFAEVTVAR